MGKNILLTEKGYLTLVENLKMGLEDKTSLLDKIMTYQGDNQFLKDMSLLILQGGTPNQSQLEKSRLEFLKSEKPITQVTGRGIFSIELFGTPENNFRDGNYRLGSSVTSQGQELYHNIKNSKKKFIFQTGNYEFAVPNQAWIQENVDSLNELKKIDKQNRLVQLSIVDENSEKYRKISVLKTLEEWISFFLEKLENTPEYFTSYVTKKEKKWTKLPKLDTNLKNWVRMLDKLNLEKKLGDGSFQEKIQNFFEQRNLEEVVLDKQDLNLMKAISQKENFELTHISLAEYELFKEQEKDFSETFKIITGTSDKGDEAEINFINFIQKNGITNIFNFSTPGNQVDMIFGIDLLIEIVGNDGLLHWIPVQVKSSETSAKFAALLSSGLGGISVYQKAKEGWVFYRKNNGLPESFQEKILRK